jgi:prepilin-type N-terminal cleavage/methylation domain-containing protein
MNRKSEKRGFSLIEVLVGTAIFLIVAIAAYSAFTSLLQLANGAQSRTLAVELADEQFEIIRNMPYVSVGLSNGIPLGILPQTQTLTRGGVTFTVGLTVRNINLASSSLQASDKLVEINVTCPNCKDFQPVTLTGQVSPANLQSASLGGALVVQALNGSGQPVEDASVTIQSLATSSVRDSDVTNVTGILNVIGVPVGTNMYRITVTKAGYSTASSSRQGSMGLSTPVNTDATVLSQQVTTTSFAIDQLSSLHVTSVTPLCAAVPNVHFSLVGAKLIGTSPSVTKYPMTNFTTGAGAQLDLNNMEWDTYSLTPTDSAYDVEGINPYSPFTLNPNNSQNVQLVVVPKSSNSLMVSVADRGSKLPISGATITLSNGGGYSQSYVTGQGYLAQTDWSGGSGQAMFGNANQYSTSNGLVDTSTSTGNIVMKQAFGLYNTAATATLESSTFDTGTTSNFYTFSWTPLSQPVLTGLSSVKFQFATNPTSTSTTWTYLGPDGTPNSYFTVPGSAINSLSNGNEFARYLAYLTTNTATVTPMVSNVSFAYTSNCIPPGQAIFQGLSAGSYTLTVSKMGYTSYSGSVTIVNGWQQQTISLGP